jgi:dihydrofolate reductase
MGRIIVVENVSLDGVMQAPGRADEDRRGDFQHGGWAIPYNDAVKGREMAGGMAEASVLLFGRRTYEDFFRVWPNRKDNPFTAVLDRTQKFVASRTLREPLPWQNSTLLPGDAAESVSQLKLELQKDLVVLGSGELVGSLLQYQLVDQMVLLIHPVILGSGRRLFPEQSVFATLRLAKSVPTTTGVVIATYERSAATDQQTTAAGSAATKGHA